MRLILLFLVLVCSYVTSYAQADIKSLLLELSASPSDTNRVNLLREISSHYLETSLDSSKQFASEGLALAEELDHIRGQIHLNNLLGNYYQRNSIVDTAMTYYDKVMELSNTSNYIKGKAIALNNIAIIYNIQGDYPKALDLYQEALDYEFTLKDTIGIAQAYNNIGVIHYYMGNLDKTLEYFELSIAMSEAVHDISVLKKGYNNLGALYDYAKDYEGALRQYQKAMVLAKVSGEKKEIGLVLNNIATAYSGLEEHAKAFEYYQQALVLRTEMRDMQGLANTYLNLAGVSYKLGKEKDMELYVSKSLDICSKHNLKFIRSEVYKHMRAYRQDKGRYEEALEYADMYQATKDSILNDERISAVAEMETKYETARKEKLLLEEQVINDNLAKENALAELKLTRRNTVLMLGGAGTLSLLFLGLFVLQRNKRKAERDKSEAILLERDLGLQAVLNAQEDERSRISKDLHDGVGQQLSGLKMGFQLLQKELDNADEQVKERMEKLTEVINDSARDVRTISHQMMPRALTQVGLAPALSDMLEKSLGNCDISYQFDELRPVGRMASSLELSLYRIAQEVINNIIKHSEAEHVDIQLYRAKDMVILNIEDDGIGFDPMSDSDGHGLLNLENRSRLIDGQLEVESSPNKGTSVRLRVPFREQ